MDNVVRQIQGKGMWWNKKARAASRHAKFVGWAQALLANQQVVSNPAELKFLSDELLDAAEYLAQEAAFATKKRAEYADDFEARTGVALNTDLDSIDLVEYHKPRALPSPEVDGE